MPTNNATFITTNRTAIKLSFNATERAAERAANNGSVDTTNLTTNRAGNDSLYSFTFRTVCSFYSLPFIIKHGFSSSHFYQISCIIAEHASIHATEFPAKRTTHWFAIDAAERAAQ